MKRPSKIIQEQSTSGIDSNILPAESVDNGTWLEMENNAGSQAAAPEVCKKNLVSLHVTPGDTEEECNLARYCKNHPGKRYMKYHGPKEGPKEYIQKRDFTEKSGVDLNGN